MRKWNGIFQHLLVDNLISGINHVAVASIADARRGIREMWMVCAVYQHTARRKYFEMHSVVSWHPTQQSAPAHYLYEALHSAQIEIWTKSLHAFNWKYLENQFVPINFILI